MDRADRYSRPASYDLASGVHGSSSSPAGRGVYGTAGNQGGITYGGRFESRSTSGRGVYGEATASTGITYGGRFENDSTSGRGVFGLVTVNSGVNYAVVGHTNSASGYDFWASGAGTNYGSPSSRRFKSNLVPIGDPLGKLSQISGVYFDWDAEHGGQHDVGMIAEEVGEVMPEIVQYEENGIDAIGMDYSKMTPLLVEAVNALRAKHDAEIAALNERLLKLEGFLSDRRVEVEQMKNDTQVRSQDGAMTSK